MSKLADLLAQRAALEKQIAAAQTQERSAAIAQIKDLMAQYGLTVADLGGKPAPTKPSGKGPRKGSKVPAKYRDPATGQAWSGRGLHPKWLREALAQGRKLSDFAV